MNTGNKKNTNRIWRKKTL